MLKSMGDYKNIVIISNFSSELYLERNDRFDYLADLLTKKGFNVELIVTSFIHSKKREVSKLEAQRARNNKNKVICTQPMLKKMCIQDK